MQFHGTKEYEGQTYHKFTNTSYYCTTEEKELTPCEPILVREDNGIVFARLPKGVYVSSYDFLKYDTGTGLSEEVQLYDFSCPVGETFSSIDNQGKKIKLRVTAEETVEISGEQLRKMKVMYVSDDSQDTGWEWDIVENIGIVTDNGFFAFCNTEITGGYSNPTDMVGSQQKIRLKSYADSEGNILFEGYDIYAPEPVTGLFNEDRVWTYTSNHSMDFSNGPYIVKMRFDGTTEYEGRLYHNYTNILYLDRSSLKTFAPCKPILVREDQGKVFARLPEGLYVSPTDYLQYDAVTGLSDEVQLYDFQCPVGETFTSINNWGEVIRIKVIGEETVEIGGENLRKIRVKYVYDESQDAGLEWDIVENIGIVSENAFFAFFNTALASGYANPTYMVGCGQGISLSRYGTSDGRALYRPYVRPLLSYDKMWEYFGYEIDNNHSDVYPEGKTDCRLSRYVTGQNKTVGDRIYTELILDGVTSWVIPYPTYNFTDPGTGVETEKVGNCVALLREEGGKVWMLLQGETVQYTAVPYKEVWTRPVTENEEVLLYDFNAGQGTVVDGWFNNVLAPAVVRYVDDLTNTGGTELWKFNLANDRPDPSWSVENGPAVYIDVNYVEGVGNIGDGNLTELWSQSPYDPVPTCICGSGEFFNNLYDRQGNLLQGGRGIKAPETQGVGGVTDETDGDGARYDLFGRRIREAARGQVYILNGRKYVGK